MSKPIIRTRAVSYDQNHLAIGLSGGEIRILNLTTPKLDFTWQTHFNDPYSISFNPSGKYLAIGMERETVLIRDVLGKEKVQTIHSAGALCLALASDLQTLGFGSTAGLTLLDLFTNQPFIKTRDGNSIAGLQLSADSRWLAITCDTGVVELRDFISGDVVIRRVFTRKQSPWVAFRDRENELLIGTNQGEIIGWKLNTVHSKKARQANTEVNRLWRQLGDKDAAKARKAVGQLLDSANSLTEMILARLKPKPVDPLDRALIMQSINKLDSDSSDSREEAVKALASFGLLAQPLLYQSLTSSQSYDAKRLTRQLLRQLEDKYSEVIRRHTRAVWLLELLGTKQARDALQELCGTRYPSWLSQAAQNALGRMRS